MREGQRQADLGRILDLVLRHNPSALGVRLDAAGWVDLDALLEALDLAGHAATAADIAELADGNADVGDLEIEEGRIRALTGHSVPVDTSLTRLTPPVNLYRAVLERDVIPARLEGIDPEAHGFVVLEEARPTNSRTGEPIVAIVDAGRMARDGYAFCRAKNRTWLVDAVPADYVSIERPAVPTAADAPPVRPVLRPHPEP